MDKATEDELRAALTLVTGGGRFLFRGDNVGFTLNAGMLFVWHEHEEAVRAVLAAYNITVASDFKWGSGMLEFMLVLGQDNGRPDFGR